jgi:hypothetical protein
MRFSPQARKRAAATLVLALGLSLGIASPATAAAGAPPKAELVDSRYCELTRIESQFMRCDNLTGEGVLAPNWVPES